MKYPSKEELRKMNPVDREMMIKKIEKKTGYTRQFLGLVFEDGYTQEIEKTLDIFSGIFGGNK